MVSISTGFRRTYLTGPRFYVSNVSKDDAFGVFKKVKEDLDERIESEEMLALADEIRADIARVEESTSPKCKVSLSTSFFAGDRYKRLGRSVGTDSANMEDYHLMCALLSLDSSGGLARRAVMRRQSEDPATIPEPVEHPFSNYLKGAKGSHPRRDYPQLTRSEYKEAVLWGLVYGRDYRRLPDAAVWSWSDQVIGENSEYAKLFYPIEAESGQRVFLNPFVEEIAADFLNSAMGGNFLREAMVNRSVLEAIHKDPVHQLLLLGQTRLANRRIEEAAKEIGAWGSRIRRVYVEDREQGERDLERIGQKLENLIGLIDFVSGEKAPLRPRAMLPRHVHAALIDKDFQEVFLPSKLGLADLQASNPLLFWTAEHRRNFDAKMIEIFLEIQKEYLESENPDAVNPLGILGLDLQPSTFYSRRNRGLVKTLDLSEQAELERGVLVHLRELKSEFLRIIRNHMIITPATTVEEIAASDQLLENYNCILRFYTLLFEGHYPLPRVGFLAKERVDLPEDGGLSIWVRPYKWASNEAGLANHLPSNFILGKEARLEKLFSDYRLQTSLLDRCMYKATLGPAMQEAAKEHVEVVLPERIRKG